MAKVPNAAEILPNVWTAWVGRTNVTDDRQTDGRQQIANVWKRTVLLQMVGYTLVLGRMEENIWHSSASYTIQQQIAISLKIIASQRPAWKWEKRCIHSRACAMSLFTTAAYPVCILHARKIIINGNLLGAISLHEWGSVGTLSYIV